MQTLHEQQKAAFAAVKDGLGRVPAEFSTAGELAALMARLPPDTPVSVAETVRLDPGLELGVTQNCTAAAARIVKLLELATDEVVEDGQARDMGVLRPGVELGAVIVAVGATVPEETVAFQPYERAVEALDRGDLDAVLDGEVELLTWMANTLTHDDPDDTETVPEWIADADLRDRLAVESERLRQAAARLGALRARVAVYQASQIAEAAAEPEQQ